jgi:hypothetical protein
MDENKHPSHVVVDTLDGMTFYQDFDGTLFDLAVATRFAADANRVRKDAYRTYQVFALAPMEDS